MRAMRATLFLGFLALAGLAGCESTITSPPLGEDTGAPGDLGRPDATDAATDDRPDGGGECASDSQCDDMTYCNGAERCVAGRCTRGTAPCDDRYACTRDTCDEAARSCTRAPDHAMCDDGDACNGRELCDPTTPGAVSGTGCQPVQVDGQIDCDDRNTCTIDACERALGCIHSPRDLDGDGRIDRACTLDGTPTGRQGDDCNDSDPRVFPGAPELCNDGRDNNCNLLIDYADSTCVPSNDTCAEAEAIPLTGPGTYNRTGSTTGLMSNFTLSCGGGTARPTAVYTFTLAAPQDVTVSTDDAAATASVALASSCTPLTETRCGRGTNGTFGSPGTGPTVTLRMVPAGTYYVLVQTTTPRVFRLRLQVGAPTSPPEYDLCPRAGMSPPIDLADQMPHVVSFGGFFADYSLTCDVGAPAPDAVYPLTIRETSNVTVVATGFLSGDQVTMALQRAPCGVATSEVERTCVTGTSPTASPAVYARNLPPGTYYVVVKNSNRRDTTIQATIRRPGDRVTGDACPGVDLTPDGAATVLNTATFDRYADYGTTCGSRTTPMNWTDWVFHFRLTAPRDVTIIMTGPTSRMQLQRSCGDAATNFGGCVATSSHVRRFLALPAGDYYIVGEATSPGGSITASVTTAAPSPRLAGELCANPSALPTDGTPVILPVAAFATVPDHGTACGSATMSGTTWRDWVFRYTLTEERDVTLTMTTDSRVPIQGAVMTRCGESASTVGTCFASGFGTSWIQRLSRQPAGTYFVVAESSSTLATVTATLTTSPPGSRPSYARSTPPPSVAWVDACAAPGHMNIYPTRDDATQRMPSPFAFRYWGVNHAPGTMVNLSTNGWLAWDGSTGDALSGSIPSAGTPNAVIAPHWGDNYTRGDGICVATLGATPNRQWVFEWSDTHYCCGDMPTVHLTYEAILYETTNVIDFLFNRMDGARSQTSGIEDPLGLEAVATCDAGSPCAPTAGLRVRFTPSTPPAP